jgi:uncharacterized protein with von Willebrand factor type A (vWA) domain
VHVCRYVHDDLLPEVMRSALEETLYNAFVGTEIVTPSATAAQATPSAAPAAATPIRLLVARMARTASFEQYTRNNPVLSERLAHDAVAWCTNQWLQARVDDRFAEEEAALRDAHGLVATEELLDAALRHRPEMAAAADVVRTEVMPPDTMAEPARRKWAEAVGRARRTIVVRDWHSRIVSDRTNHETRILSTALGGYLRNLQAVLPGMAAQQQLVRDLFGSDERLFDLSESPWETVSTKGLQATADMLRGNVEIERLAETIGRSRLVTEEQTRDVVSTTTLRTPEGIGKSEVTGLAFGDELTSLLASESSLLSSPDASDLFFAKLAHKELLVLDYRRERVVEHERRRTTRISEIVTLPRGPLIVCVDTSGSMLGTPELVAKAIVLALATRLAQDGRAVHVIAFSTGARSFSMTGNTPFLEQLLGFLGGGFHGGTDLRPALEASLALLEEESYRLADVLVVSDFRVPKIADRFVDRIKRQQRSGTLFHSLTIADSPVRDPLNIFDNSWLFSTGRPGIDPASLRAIQ